MTPALDRVKFILIKFNKIRGKLGLSNANLGNYDQIFGFKNGIKHEFYS